ncbi:MAG: hypothetical protein JST00_01450 [Deltaproteobacteria bacterium]|nr:hypothetical protein [Deltaproteobacteria bacterium]
MLRCHRMGADRLGVAIAVLAVAIVAACSSASEPPGPVEAPKGEVRLPDPPPRYAHYDPGPSSSSNAADPDAGRIYECGGRTPFACPLEDGTVVCSTTPCLPDCSRIGCVGGDVCRACDGGGYRCVDAKTGC